MVIVLVMPSARCGGRAGPVGHDRAPLELRDLPLAEHGVRHSDHRRVLRAQFPGCHGPPFHCFTTSRAAAAGPLRAAVAMDTDVGRHNSLFYQSMTMISITQRR